jgi:hypothetical protein
MISSYASSQLTPTIAQRMSMMPWSVDWSLVDTPWLTVLRRWPGGSYVAGGAYKPDDIAAWTWRDSADGQVWEIRARCTADPGVDPGHRQGTIAAGFWSDVWRRGPMHQGTPYEQDCLVPTGQPLGYWPTNDRRVVSPSTPMMIAGVAQGICMHRGYGPQVGNNSDACVAVFDVPEFDHAMAALDALFARTHASSVGVALLELPDGHRLLEAAPRSALADLGPAPSLAILPSPRP